MRRLPPRPLALPLLLSLALALPQAAHAGKKKKELRDDIEQISDRGPAATAEDIPMLARLLARTGWTPTPELSGAFRPGYVFLATEQGHRLQLEDCFTVPATASTYTAAEVVSQLQAGVSVELGLASVGASGGIVKKVRFGTPVHYSVPMLKMIPTQACRQALLGAEAVGMDLSRMYAVQEVLTAEITEQTCGRLDASGRFVGVGSADLSLAAGCAQSSMEPVAVAYRITPVNDLVALYRTTAAQADPPQAPATQAPADSRLLELLTLSPVEPPAAPAPSRTPTVAEALHAVSGEQRTVLIGAAGIDWSLLAGVAGPESDPRIADPDGTSIYDSLTFANRDEKLVVPAAASTADPAADPAVVAVGVEMVLAGAAPAIADCGMKAQGSWRVRFEVAADGAVRDVSVSGWDHGDGAVEACIAGVAAGLRFPSPPEPYAVARTFRFGG